MQFDHGPDCPHCQVGCEHPHSPYDPLGLIVGDRIKCAPGELMVPGSAGAYIDSAGFTLASNHWLPVRCLFCRGIARTPVEALASQPPALDDEGNILTCCASCQADIDAGHRPGHNPNRRYR